MTHDYKRHGTTTLFAALDVASGAVIARCKPRHRHQEFLAFLRHLDRNFPADADVHLIIDNYRTHKHPKVRTCSPCARVTTAITLRLMLHGLIKSSAGLP